MVVPRHVAGYPIDADTIAMSYSGTFNDYNKAFGQKNCCPGN